MDANQSNVVHAYNPDSTDVNGRRTLAALIDIAVIFILWIVLIFTIGDKNQYSYANGNHYTYGVSYNIAGAKFFVCLGLVLLYFFLCEAISGQTLGKRLLKLRVLRLDGTRAGPAAIAVRSLFRLVDWLPIFNILGLVFVLATHRHQRLGDLLAKTVVVRQ